MTPAVARSREHFKASLAGGAAGVCSCLSGFPGFAGAQEATGGGGGCQRSRLQTILRRASMGWWEGGPDPFVSSSHFPFPDSLGRT